MRFWNTNKGGWETWPENFIRSRWGQCFVCHKRTQYIEVNFEAFLHPGICEDKMWEDYERALRTPVSP